MKVRINLKKWIARFLVVVMILTCVPVYHHQEVRAANYTIANNGTGGIWIDIMGSPYSNFSKIPTWGINAYGEKGCAWFASARAKQITNKNVSTIYSGQNWYNNQYKTYGLARGKDIIKAPAIICFSGHVAILEKIEGDTAYISEGGLYNSGRYGNAYKNWGNWTPINANNGHCAIHAVSKSEIKSCGGLRSDFIGFVYLTGGNPIPTPIPQSASIKAVSCDKYDNNLVPRAKVYNPGKRRITTIGVQIRDGNNVIASKQETIASSLQYVSNANIWYDCNSECGVRLRPGHTYNWQIYANVGGQTVYTGWIYDKTTGTEKPNPPSFSTAKTHYAVGDALTVSWGADSNATAGYSLTITQTKGGSYKKTLTTNTANATSLAFTLPEEGEYKITGYARGSSNSDMATLNKTIVAHNPSKVRFVEYDKDGNENLLCEQTVRYGYSATAPTGISRKGHTFMGWKGEYSNVTSDRTIEAQFKRNTYKIVFCDKDGKTIKTESVLFEGDATAPETPAAEKGYVFAGWDSEDYKNVQGNATIKASYVWANDDLPVVITLNKCEFKDDGYIINYDIKNNPNKRTKGRALVSLKTSKGKLLDSTESKAFSLGKAEEKKGIEIYVPYEGTATKADLYIINGFSKGIPISEVATVNVERNWSEWSTEEPDEKNEIESRTEYRHQDLESTTTRTNSNAGWTLEKSVLDGNWNYGGWSGWSRNSYSAYTNETSKREVETRRVQDSAAYTLYNWYYYRYYNTSARTYYYTYSSSMGGTRYDWQTNYCLPQIGTYSGHAGYKPPGGKNFSSEIWFLASTQNVGATSHTEWRYRDASKGYTYYWNRWKDWSDWSTTEAKESEQSKVQTRTTYRYRAKMEDVEDNSGKSYTISGKLDQELAGKQATLLVYKNDEPSDSNNEYVGQMMIGDDGSYSYEFIPRQPISAKTGDYTVALAIEGAEDPVFLETIEAPKPVYTVTFKDNEGNVIDTQKVTEGKSATSPKVADKEHYRFVGWDFGFTNVRDDMEITAQYTKNKYSVAYVNWETKEAETKVFSYGEPLDYPDETSIEGYDFVGWTTLDGEKVSEVTDNLVLQANYKIQTYTINFYNKEEKLINSQQVEYGQDAVEPEHEEIEMMNFKGWNTYGFIQAKSNLDVYPVYEWKETTENPTCDIKSGVFTEKTKVHLEAEQGAVIFYTLDGSAPNEFSNKYSGEIIISRNSFLQFVAVSPQKNMSETQSVSFLVASGEDDEGALVVKREKYKLDRGSDEKITYFLSHENPDIEVNFYSLDENIATVEEDGTIHANNVGTTRIFVSTKDNKYADYCDVEVTTDDVDVETIVLDKISVAGVPDEVIQMNATVYPENATEKEIDWYTEDNSVATVSETGELKILKKGSTTLHAYAKSGTCIAECEVQGVSEFEESKLEISTPYLFLYEKDMDMLYTYYGDADVQCRWSSTDEEVATVEDGMVTAKKAGRAFITATAEDGTQVTSLIVVDKKPDEGMETEKPGTGATPEPTKKPTENPDTEETKKPSEVTDPEETKDPSGDTTPEPTKDPTKDPSGDKTPATAMPKPTTPNPTVPNQFGGSVTQAPGQPANTKKSPAVKAPGKIKGVKVKREGRKKLKVSWKWVAWQDGFEVRYAQNKSFTKGKKTKKYGSYTETAVLKGLKSKKSYYVQVRAYKYSSGKKVYGSWSGVKKCKVK